VLLILAGVSIAMLTGENGILTKADSTTRETEIAEAKEQAKLDIAEWTADQLEKGKSANISNSIIQEILTGKEYVGNIGTDKFTTKKNGYEILYADLYNGSIVESRTPKIPEGFYVVPELDKVEDGFVISDIENDTEDKGNQFVWVPVPDMNNFHRIEGYYNKQLDTNLKNCSEPFQNGYAEEDTDYTNMYHSVEINHGFYMGRYEAGKEGIDTVVCKKGATVYNNIKWGNSMTDATGGAVEKAKNFTKDKIYKDSVTSTLVYGVQWDATMQFMDDGYSKGECSENSYVISSLGKGNYGTSVSIPTGSNSNYAVKNIYDMAGNVFEWTMEACNTDKRINRGGACSRDNVNYPASNRMQDDPTRVFLDLGFRIALYL